MKNETTVVQNLAVFVRLEDCGTSYDGKRMAWAKAYVCTAKPAYNDFSFAASYNDISKYEYIRLTELVSTERETDMGEIKAHDIMYARADELESIAKTLKAIHRKCEAMNALFGRPSTFGQSVLRLANAVGAKIIITAKSEEAKQRTGEKWRMDDLAQGQYCIDSDIAAWRAKWSPAKVGENA